MQLDFAARELTVKLVYYGPALSGKTTNLQALHQATDPGSTGRLMTLETKDDRTLFFDLLPLTFKSKGELSVRLKVFTVPGQVIHGSTRRLVVQGADGVAFIADSQVAETQHNAEAFLDLKENLKANGLSLKQMPLIIQFNKRDMKDVRSDEEIAKLAAQGREPVYLAVAMKGQGVVESFLGLLHLTWSALEAEHDLGRKFGFDSRAFMQDVAAKLGDRRSVAEILGCCVGGALEVLQSGGDAVNAQPSGERSLDELTLGSSLALEELVDRAALGEMATSFHDLFGVPLRIFSEAGVLLADASSQPAIYEYLAENHRRAKHALQEVVTAVKRVDTSQKGEASYTCFTGAVYHVVAIRYDSRPLGRMVLGPFLPPSVKEIPQSLLVVDPEVDVAKVKELLVKMPRAREETVRQIARHLRGTLDLILFSGHKALLTSSMHLASVRESFRDLQDKNDKLQEAYDKLKELDRLKSNFLATVSHELRTPLTSIIGYSEMLAEGIAGEMSTEQRDFVRTIHEKGEQLLELITGLLDLSKLESGTLAMKKTDVSVADVVADVVQTVSPSARKRGVNVKSEVAAALPKLWADPTRLRQVLLNLTDNALKFTPTGGSVHIGCRMMSVEAPDDDEGGLVLLRSRQPALELRVSDTGIGIPDAEKLKVFDAFYQVDSSSTRQVGGTGLGLSIVKRLVEGHAGTVHVEDNQPTGAAFVVTIPFRKMTLA